MERNELRARLALHLIPGVGSIHIQRLLDFFGSADAVLGASRKQLAQVAGLSPALVDQILRERDRVAVERELELIAQHGCRLIPRGDAAYPERLSAIYDPPALLYVRGEILPEDEKAIAVVGTRRPSAYGRRVTERLTRELVAQGFTIVSGLARGIDGIAHRAALEAGGRTLAVLGNGLSRIYPEEHAELADQIAQQGALISEFPMQAAPLAAHFPQRNRVISGLCLGVLVTEAAERSGSLITARWAVDQGREVFAVPGEIDSRNAAGPHRLIQQGAALVTCVEDILQALPGYVALPSPTVRVPPQQEPPAELNPEEVQVWQALGTDAVHIDTLIQKLGTSPAQIASLLMMMEIKGFVQQLPGKFFMRKWFKGS